MDSQFRDHDCCTTEDLKNDLHLNIDVRDEIMNQDAGSVDMDYEPIGDEGFNNHQSICKPNYEMIEKSEDQLELVKVKQELLRVLNENETLKVSYSKLLEQKSKKCYERCSIPRNKIVFKLKEELEQKTIFCQNISNKLELYKKKYKSMKNYFLLKTGETNSPIPGSPNDNLSRLKLKSIPKSGDLFSKDTQDDSFELRSQLRELQQRNASLIAELEESRMKNKLSNPNLLPFEDEKDSLFNWCAVIEQIRTKANDVTIDAHSIVYNINKIKEHFEGFIRNTPSTSVLEDFKENKQMDMEDESQSGGKNETDEILGKRVIRYMMEDYNEESSSRTSILPDDKGAIGTGESMTKCEKSLGEATNETNEITHDIPSDTLPQPLVLTEQELIKEQEDNIPLVDTIDQLKEEKSTTKKGVIFTHGSSDEDESSLSRDNVIDEVDSQKLFYVNPEGNSQSTGLNNQILPLISINNPSKVLVTQKTSNSDSNNYMLSDKFDKMFNNKQHDDKDNMIKTSTPSLIDKDMNQILGGSKLPSINTSTPIPPISTVNNRISIPTFLKTTQTTLIHQSLLKDKGTSLEGQMDKRISWRSLYSLLEKVKKDHTSENTIEMYKDTLSRFKNNTSNNITTHLSVLMQTSMTIKKYSIRQIQSCLGERDIIDEDNVYQVYIYQTALYLIYISYYLDTDLIDASHFDHILSYRNKDGFMADKFDKIKEIVSNSKTKLNNPMSNTPHHFAMMKIVFYHLLLSIERSIVNCRTDEYFSSNILSKKMNYIDLKDSCHYALGKVSLNNDHFEFGDGLEDLLMAFNRLSTICGIYDISLNKYYFEGLRGVFSNQKYRNTSQQIVVCIIFKQLNTEHVTRPSLQ